MLRMAYTKPTEMSKDLHNHGGAERLEYMKEQSRLKPKGSLEIKADEVETKEEVKEEAKADTKPDPTVEQE